MRFKDYVREQIEVIRDRDPAMKDDKEESSTRPGKYRSAPRERPV